MSKSDSERASLSHQGNWYVLVFGLPHPPEVLVLAPGMSLLPLASPLDIFDLMALGAAGFRESAVLDPFMRGCTCEIESPADSATTPGFDSLNRAWLAIALLVLRGFPLVKGVAVSTYRWGSVPDPEHAASWIEATDPVHRRTRTNLPRFRGGLLDLHLRMLQCAGARREVLTVEDTEWVRGSFEAANHLSSDSESFRLALQAAVDWRFATEPRSAIARLWSGIEAIFGISSELVYRVSVIASCLLAGRGAERLNRFRDVKNLYGVRSKAVHGDTLTMKQLDDGIAHSFELLRDLLVLQIERAEVFTQEDFEKAIFY